jgi:hypothetical protein
LQNLVGRKVEYVEDHYLTSKTDEVKRIGFSGTIWFGATAIAAAIPLGALLSAGWRPADLPEGAAIAWWFGTALVTLGIASLAYAGCPVIGGTLEHDDRIKSIAVRLGLALYGIGAVAALLAVLVSAA